MSTAAEAARPGGVPPSGRLRIVRLIVLLLLVLAVWAWADVQSLGIDSSNGLCSLRESEHSNPLEGFTYRHLMSSRFTDKPTHPVALVTLSPPNEPLSVLTNTCEGRRFFAALVPALKNLGAKVIAIDKFYSAGACPAEDVNTLFRSALHRVEIPVIVGQATQPAGDEDRVRGDCLVLIPPLAFGADGPPGPSGNVLLGLTRLNENTLQIPLEWPVFPPSDETGGAQPASHPAPGLSYVAATAADPGLASDPRLLPFLKTHQHPFATFDEGLPTWSAMDVLCYGGDAQLVKQEKWGTCSKIPHLPFRLAGKTVVVGEHVDADLQPFPDGDKYGVDLQANYIESLISRRFVSELDHRADWLLLGLFLALFGVFDLFSDRILGRLPKAAREACVVLFGFALLLIFTVFSRFLLIHRDLLTPIFLLALYPILFYLAVRLLWWPVTLARDRLTPAREIS